MGGVENAGKEQQAEGAVDDDNDDGEWDEDGVEEDEDGEREEGGEEHGGDGDDDDEEEIDPVVAARLGAGRVPDTASQMVQMREQQGDIQRVRQAAVLAPQPRRQASGEDWQRLRQPEVHAPRGGQQGQQLARDGWQAVRQRQVQAPGRSRQGEQPRQAQQEKHTIRQAAVGDMPHHKPDAFAAAQMAKQEGWRLQRQGGQEPKVSLPASNVPEPRQQLEQQPAGRQLQEGQRQREGVEARPADAKVPLADVALMTVVMAAAAGLGALPFFFVRSLSRRMAGLTTAVACGVMFACSFDLVHTGVGGRVGWVNRGEECGTIPVVCVPLSFEPGTTAASSSHSQVWEAALMCSWGSTCAHA